MANFYEVRHKLCRFRERLQGFLFPPDHMGIPLWVTILRRIFFLALGLYIAHLSVVCLTENFKMRVGCTIIVGLVYTRLYDGAFIGALRHNRLLRGHATLAYVAFCVPTLTLAFASALHLITGYDQQHTSLDVCCVVAGLSMILHLVSVLKVLINRLRAADNIAVYANAVRSANAAKAPEYPSDIDGFLGDVLDEYFGNNVKESMPPRVTINTEEPDHAVHESSDEKTLE